MEFKLSKILESTVLSEGRKEDAMKKYGASKELVDQLSSNDPSGNNKYLDWMTKQVTSNSGDQEMIADNVIAVVKRFHKQAGRLTTDMANEANVNSKAKKNPKDINTYNDTNELLTIVRVAEKKATDKQIKKEAEKIYEDNDVLVIVPITTRASCKYGSGSKWCITSPGNTHFESYSKNAVFYFITDKTTTQRENPTHYKYALQYSHNGEKTWWDAEDRSHRNTPTFMTSNSGKKAMKVIDAYQVTAAGEKLKREIQRFIMNPTSRKYSDYGSHLTPEQKTEVIEKIIMDEGATVTVLDALIDDLTDKQKNFILLNLTGLNTSTFNRVKDKLNDTQLLNVIKNNPVVLNNSESINYIDSKLNDEQKFNLARSLDKSNVSNTDSKVIIKKWSMTPEERSKHGQQSTYVFLMINDEIDKIIKVDSLDPESYKIINGLKLKTAMDNSLSMYAVRTEGGLLDEYVGKGGSAVPKEKILAKASKI